MRSTFFIRSSSSAKAKVEVDAAEIVNPVINDNLTNFDSGDNLYIYIPVFIFVLLFYFYNLFGFYDD
jgi:hypothetical protein